jgi:hypothetical protein
LQFGSEIDRKHTYVFYIKCCFCKSNVTNMATIRIFDITSDTFNVYNPVNDIKKDVWFS